MWLIIIQFHLPEIQTTQDLVLIQYISFLKIHTQVLPCMLTYVNMNWISIFDEFVGINNDSDKFVDEIFRFHLSENRLDKVRC